MRSLGTVRVRVRARVARLASIFLPSPELLMLLHWMDRYERCPSCAADLESWLKPSPAVRLAILRQPWCSIRPKT